MAARSPCRAVKGLLDLLRFALWLGDNILYGHGLPEALRRANSTSTMPALAARGSSGKLSAVLPRSLSRKLAAGDARLIIRSKAFILESPDCGDYNNIATRIAAPRAAPRKLRMIYAVRVPPHPSVNQI